LCFFVAEEEQEQQPECKREGEGERERFNFFSLFFYYIVCFLLLSFKFDLIEWGQPPVTTVIFKVVLHCLGCIDKIKKTVEKAKGEVIVSFSFIEFSVVSFTEMYIYRGISDLIPN
jgi:hypothetical protein